MMDSTKKWIERSINAVSTFVEGCHQAGDSASVEYLRGNLTLGDLRGVLAALESTRPEDALRLPLRNLMKESAAMLALCEPQLREAAGNTNVAVFLQRITEAAEAFEQHAPQVEKP